jgi:vacuolar-type H+-ATPase subunit E/Vma4
VGYRELLQALQDEVGCQVRELREKAIEESRHIRAATERDIVSKRNDTLDAEGQRLLEEATRSLAQGRLERERALLKEMRREMEAVRVEVQTRLPARDSSALLARLVEDVVPHVGEGPVEFRVKPGHEHALRSHLERLHPSLVPRATIHGSSDVSGGVRLSLAGRQILDNTLPSRLEKAWQLLEADIAGILFGDAHGGT